MRAGGGVPFEELRRFLFNHPTAMVTLLAQHVDDGSGHCRSCRIGNQRGFLAWPCVLHTAATSASIDRAADGTPSRRHPPPDARGGRPTAR
jgi:hypothetical protein